MTCEEFYNLNATDGTDQAMVLEGRHPVTEAYIFLSIVFYKPEGWAIRTEEDTVIDHTVGKRDLTTLAMEWLYANFGDYERKESVELETFYDEILSQLITTESGMDITYSGLYSAIEQIEKDKIHEGMAHSIDLASLPMPPVPDLGIIEDRSSRTVLIVSESKKWHDSLYPIFKKEKFVPFSTYSIEEGIKKYETLPNCAIVLDAIDLSEGELQDIRDLKREHSSLFVVAVIGQECLYEEAILFVVRDVFEVPASQIGIVKALHRFFLRTS